MINEWMNEMNNNYFEIVGKNISEVLANKDMTQQALADRLSISRQVVNKIVQGQKAINVSEITKIAAVLNVSIDTLLNDSSVLASEPTFSFMGKINNPNTKEKILLIKEAIDELLFLEDYADGFSN